MLLNCHTYYSFCYGTLTIDELFEELKSKQHKAFVLSDINNTSAILEAIRISKNHNIKLIPGIDFRNGAEQKYIGIAQNNLGFKELNQHLSSHLSENKNFDDKAPSFNNAFVIYPFRSFKGDLLNENEYIGIHYKELNSLPFSAVKNFKHKLVILQTVNFIYKKQFNAHRLLRAIDKNVLLSKLPIVEQATISDVALSIEDFYQLFQSHPIIIKNTNHIIDTCFVDFEYGKFANKNLKHYTGSASNDAELLRTECIKGLKYRYVNPSSAVLDRVEKELRIITKMDFSSYFLINWDIVGYAQNKNYYYVVRGSGANSIIAYLLRITDVDPIKLDLYFERFINESRTNPPDFDIDFSWTDRDDITRYIFDRFGKERTALLATYSTFQSDSVIRELGKVFGLPPNEIDKLQVLKEQPNDTISELVIKYSQMIHGFPSHLSIHSSGILISQEPIHTYSATFLPPKGYPTTQFSMLEAEDIGLYKFDILSQRGLSKIKDCVTIIKQNYNVEIDIHDVNSFYENVRVKDALRAGKCIGCFYIESPAMRMLLAKLQADDYLRLVAASSIIRPGVSKSGMMREYILRYRDVNKRKQAKDKIPPLYELLEETYGVMVYQEDVIKVAHYFAGLSLAEADYLRRGMSWKFKQRNEFWKVKETFFSNCINKGYEKKVIDDIWNQIESFANYAFSKGHSASYAVESFQALYLKTYYPIEYMVATLNNGGGFYRTELYIHEARMHGAEINSPCVNNSIALCTIKDNTVFLGLNMISELELHSISSIIKERDCNNIFSNLYDFINRVPISLEQIRLLIRVNAFNFTGKNKKELLWEAHSIINPLKKSNAGLSLFEVEAKKYKLPELITSWVDDAFDELELLGFTLCSPFKLLRNVPTHFLTAQDLTNNIGKIVEIIGYMITVKSTRTSKGDRMFFGTFIDVNGNWIDTVHFPQAAKEYSYKGRGCYSLKGKVVVEFDFISIEVSEMRHLPVLSREDVLTNKRASGININAAY